MARITERNDKFTRLIIDKYMSRVGKSIRCDRDESLSNVYHLSCELLGIDNITVRVMYPDRDAHNNIKGKTTVINNIDDIIRTGIEDTFYIFTDEEGNLYQVPGIDMYHFCIDNNMNNGVVRVGFTPDKKYIIER